VAEVGLDWPAIARRIRVPVGFAFAVIYLWLAQPTRTSLIMAAPVAVLGLIIRGIASGHVQKNEQLTTTGPYAHTRNPLYLGTLALACGFAIAARSWWIVAGMAVIFAAVYLPVIGSEEKFLRERFPEFAEYAAHVPRLRPRLRPFGNNEGAFSWELYRKHREYNAILGMAAMTAALVVKLLWISK
jgi:protein-S-isoprenylcysteine O-methyltransferase Ste14